MFSLLQYMYIRWIYLTRKGVTTLFFKAPTPLHNTPPFWKCLFFNPVFSFHPILIHFIQSPLHLQQSIHEHFRTYQLFPKPSYWRYLLPAANHSHLVSDETNQNLVHFFSVLFFVTRLDWLPTFVTSSEFLVWY